MRSSFGHAYIVLRSDGEMLGTIGYSGNHKPIPYWTESLKEARVYLSENGADAAALKYGGRSAKVQLNYYGDPDKIMPSEVTDE